MRFSRFSGEKSNSLRATSSVRRFGGGLLRLKEPDQSAGVIGCLIIIGSFNSFFAFFKSLKFGSFFPRGSKATRLERGASRATGSASTRGASRGQGLDAVGFGPGIEGLVFTTPWLSTGNASALAEKKDFKSLKAQLASIWATRQAPSVAQRGSSPATSEDQPHLKQQFIAKAPVQQGTFACGAEGPTMTAVHSISGSRLGIGDQTPILACMKCIHVQRVWSCG